MASQFATKTAEEVGLGKPVVKSISSSSERKVSKKSKFFYKVKNLCFLDKGE